MSTLNEDRQHAPTPARLKRAREDGDVAHSNELATAIQMVASVGALWFCAATIGNGLQQTTINLWSESTISSTPESIVRTSQSMLWKSIRLLLPFLLSLFAIGTLAHVAQTRFLFKAPKFSLSSVSGQRWFETLFSISNFGQIVIASPKVLVSLGTGAVAVWIYRESFFSLGGVATDQFAPALLGLTSIVSMCVALSLLACSVFDYATKWFAFNQRIRMTDHEMREELRGQSGDPQIARIRHQRMREISRDQQ